MPNIVSDISATPITELATPAVIATARLRRCEPPVAAKGTPSARVMADIESVYPVDGEVPGDQIVLLDTEWKVLVDGRLIIKQVRPFLR